MSIKMAKLEFFLGVLFCLVIRNGLAQENTQTVVAKSLEECYNNSEIVNRDNKLPMTLPVLIDLIRKIENGQDPIDLSALAVSLLHRFRQDGIVKAFGVNEATLTEGVLNYSPNYRFTNDKFKIVLKYMVPGNQFRFPNDTLNVKERCTLHSMLSSSIEDWERGDEAKVCNQVGKYTRRVRRRRGAGIAKAQMPADVEFVDVGNSDLRDKGAMMNNPDVERVGKVVYPKSDCPVETGVIYTPWGNVAVGPLIAGIAAGAQPDQHININDLTKSINTNRELDNLWGATIAGDLAEAALYKNEDDPRATSIAVGAHGGWNSTTEPHWYFLERTNQLFCTDAEIRGGLDGLYLGSMIRTNLSRVAPNLKLSQLLDMYYTRGVFNNNYRACRRRELFTEFTTMDTLKEQTEAFAILLNKEVRLSMSYEEGPVVAFADEAAKNLQEYIASKLNDLPCLAYSASDDSSIATDILIVVDLQFGLSELRSILSTTITGLDINQYNGNFTIINAQDGSILVNSSNSLVDLVALNETVYNTAPKGINMVNSIRQVEELAKNIMEYEKMTEARGRSLTALFILSTDPTIDMYVVNRVRDYINVFTPDLRMFVLTKGTNKDIYANIVKDSSRDIVTYTASTSSNNDMKANIAPVIDRIKEVPRRFVNVKCGSTWSASSGGNVETLQYVTPGTVNFYRVHPNYFFGDGSKSIKIKAAGSDSLTMCHSRSNVQPRANVSSSGSSNSGDVSCKTVTAQEYIISLNDACTGKTFIHDCVPLYFSVQAGTEVSTTNCNDKGCRNPDDIKFSILGENLVCQSAAFTLTPNIMLCFTVIIAILFKTN